MGLGGATTAFMDNNFNKAKEYVSRSEYEKAYQEYLKSAENGNTEAMNEIAMLYAQGMGVERSNKMAFNWFLKSALKGNGIAEFNVGMAYEQGLGVEQDINEAIKWYEKSADKGTTKAQINLAYLYVGNNGIRPDVNMAIKYIEMYADKASLTAFRHLGTLKENISKELSSQMIEGRLFLRQSTAHEKAIECMHNNKNGFTQCLMTLRDISLFPNYDESIMSNGNVLMEYAQRNLETKKASRLIPCYEVEASNGKVLGRFGFQIEDETNFIVKTY